MAGPVWSRHEPLGGGGTAVTVTSAVPLTPSLVAVIVADPGVAPVTRPAPSTVATAAWFVVQVTGRPLSGCPLRSRGVAASCADCPTSMWMVAGLTVTEATDPASVMGLERWQPTPVATARAVTHASEFFNGASRRAIRP